MLAVRVGERLPASTIASSVDVRKENVVSVQTIEMEKLPGVYVGCHRIRGTLAQIGIVIPGVRRGNKGVYDNYPSDSRQRTYVGECPCRCGRRFECLAKHVKQRTELSLPNESFVVDMNPLLPAFDGARDAGDLETAAAAVQDRRNRAAEAEIAFMSGGDETVSRGARVRASRPCRVTRRPVARYGVLPAFRCAV